MDDRWRDTYDRWKLATPPDWEPPIYRCRLCGLEYDGEPHCSIMECPEMDNEPAGEERCDEGDA